MADSVMTIVPEVEGLDEMKRIISQLNEHLEATAELLEQLKEAKATIRFTQS